ncbi:hypothetical protein [Aeromonas salmonicida]|uniref:hypothetical protein n=1 Tax=Aeromonas salmonicida TaxID=645 RepID=UPI002116DD3E|nr:hypothetical protein [Aeromonas salmonicida]UUI61675.1 hypothetical protein NP805_03470 [Aeromonas salmonicida]
MSSTLDKFNELSTHLSDLLDCNPIEAVKQAQDINLNLALDTRERFNLMGLQAAILIDGGALTQQQDAIEEGLALFRELHSLFPNADVTYNLGNGLVAAIGSPPQSADWLSHQELTRERRAEARRCFWKVAQDMGADLELRTQAWTNLASQFSSSYRLGEAQDGWLAALDIDPKNGVAAFAAASNLLWLYELGSCSELTRIEAIMLAKIADRHRERIIQYAGAQAAEKIAAFACQLEEPPIRSPHSNPFINWIERERLTLAPTVELIDPSMGKLDWLMLPGIMERETNVAGMPPPVFAMFNMLKSDFIVSVQRRPY